MIELALVLGGLVLLLLTGLPVFAGLGIAATVITFMV